MSSTGDVEVLLKVLGDSSSAQKSVAEYAAATQKFTQQAVKDYGVQSQAATVAAREIKTQVSQALGQVDFLNQRLGKSSAEWARQAIPEIERYKQKIQSLGAQLETLQGQQSAAGQQVQSLGHRMRASTDDLLALRRVMYATFGLVSFGYMIGEWGHLAKAVKETALAVGGFGVAAQKAHQADIKATDDALVHFQGLTLGIKMATGQFLISQTSEFLAALDTQQKATQAHLEAIRAWLGPLGAMFDIKDLIARYRQSNQEATLNERLNAQLKEMTKLEQQLHAQQAKGAHAAARQADEAKRLADQLGNLIQREKDEAEQLGMGDSRRRQALATYDREIAAIQRVVAAAKQKDMLTAQMEQQSLDAQELALENYERRVAQISAQEVQQSAAKFAAIQQQQEQFWSGVAAKQPKFEAGGQLETFKAMAQAMYGVKVQAGSMKDVQAQARAGTEALTRSARDYLSVTQMEPAALAAIAREYPGITVGQMAALPWIRQVAQGWKDQDSTMNQALSDSLDRLQQFENLLPGLPEKFDVAFARMGPTMQTVGLGAAEVVTGMAKVGEAVTKAGVAAAIYGENVGKAMEKAAKAALASIAEQSAWEAIFYLAKAIGDLFWNPSAAASEFEAAAMFAVVAAGAGAIASAIPGGGKTRTRSSYGRDYGGAGGGGYGGGGGSGAGGEAAEARVAAGQSSASLALVTRPASSMQPSGNVTIVVGGNREIASYVAGVLNDHVQNNGGQLYASRATSQPYVSPGGR